MLQALVLAVVAMPAPTRHVGDVAPLLDPGKPVVRIERTRVILEYFTNTKTQTRVQLRPAGIQMATWAPPGARRDPWTGPDVFERLIDRRASHHRIEITGLRPGTRYYYRIWDPGPKTRLETLWGATPEWRREFAVSTLAPEGGKSIIRVPVKVLLMTNVVATRGAAPDTPMPSAMTPEQLAMIKQEYHEAALFFWVNSGMRFWADWHFFVDSRWQVWGREVPDAAGGAFRDAPMSRAYPGVDFRPPGGGLFTILDTRDVARHNNDPVFEPRPYAGQIEQAFLRRWDANRREWVFANSGGGTFGVDFWPEGRPSRSQFLGGGDTAWLVCHEFHHQMESFGAFSLANREDERIVFNHYAPRFREARPDGGYDEVAWTSNSRHGEHWDGMRYWDRWVTDAQWLRMYVGETIVVRDADHDGFPDDDPRLPLDERRFGSDPARARTDGQMTDLHKAMLGTWIPNPLQSSWVKPPPQYPRIDPRRTDQDGDGTADPYDPYPLWRYPQAIWPMRATIDGDGSEWERIPLNGTMNMGGIGLQMKQSYDAAAFYLFLHVRGPWRRIELTLDGEGDGVFGRRGVQWLHITREAGQIGVRTLNNTGAGLVFRATPGAAGDVIELSLPNRGVGTWFWTGAGRPIGTQLNVFHENGAGYSMGSPYTVFYSVMLDAHGRPPPPENPPAELEPGEGVTVLRPGAPELRDAQGAWTLAHGALAYDGQDERPLWISVPPSTAFDFWVRMTANQDGILGAYAPGTEAMTAGVDYVVFVGGYGNTITRFRLFGAETGEGEEMMTPGRQRSLQFTRRDGMLWILVDGRPTAWAPDPQPARPIDRLAIIGGHGGRQRVHEVRFRTGT
jgi:hypothetical protein